MKTDKIKIIEFKNHKLHFRKTAGSHIPLLRNITKFFDVKNVIEFGTGIYSLKTFLDHKYYPNLQDIYSYETSKIWLEFVQSYCDDDRWHSYLISLDHSKLKDIKFPNFSDIVFVDGENSHREPILRNFKFLSDIFVLHDCETDLFKYLTDEFKYKFIYSPQKYRHTAILSDKYNVDSLGWNIKWEDDFFDWK